MWLPTRGGLTGRYDFTCRVKFFSFGDSCRDIAPEGEYLKETNANLDELTDLALELQEKTGVKLLWATCNLFANPR